jgi:hypothetical protein
MIQTFFIYGRRHFLIISTVYILQRIFLLPLVHIVVKIRLKLKASNNYTEKNIPHL